MSFVLSSALRWLHCRRGKNYWTTDCYMTTISDFLCKFVVTKWITDFRVKLFSLGNGGRLQSMTVHVDVVSLLSSAALLSGWAAPSFCIMRLSVSDACWCCSDSSTLPHDPPHHNNEAHAWKWEANGHLCSCLYGLKGETLKGRFLFFNLNKMGATLTSSPCEGFCSRQV